MKILQHVLLLISVAFVMAMAPVFAGDVLVPGDYEAYDKFTVIVRTNSALGSGVIVDVNKEAETVTIVTAYHNFRTQFQTLDGRVRYAKKARIHTKSGANFNGGIIASSEMLDLALVRVSNVSPFALRSAGFTAVPEIRTSLPLIGEDIFIVGHKLGLKWSYSFGKVMRSTRFLPGVGRVPFIQIDSITNRGDSGGGLFDARGALLGVTLQKPNTSLFGFVMPIKNVCRMHIPDDMKRVFHCKGKTKR